MYRDVPLTGDGLLALLVLDVELPLGRGSLDAELLPEAVALPLQAVEALQRLTLLGQREPGTLAATLNRN